MKKPDDVLARVEAFSAARGGGALAREAARGCSLSREGTGQPAVVTALGLPAKRG